MGSQARRPQETIQGRHARCAREREGVAKAQRAARGGGWLSVRAQSSFRGAAVALARSHSFSGQPSSHPTHPIRASPNVH